jgi:hypothetical protein
MVDSHTSEGVQAHYYFAFVTDDLLIIRGLDYVEVLKVMKVRDNNLPKFVQEYVTLVLALWKKDYRKKYSLLRTEVMTVTMTIHQQTKALFTDNEYIIFRIKCYGAYPTLILTFLMRDINCSYLGYKTMQINVRHVHVLYQ